MCIRDCCAGGVFCAVADSAEGLKCGGQDAAAELNRMRLDAAGARMRSLPPGCVERYIGQLEHGSKSPILRAVDYITEGSTSKPSAILLPEEHAQETRVWDWV